MDPVGRAADDLSTREIDTRGTKSVATVLTEIAWMILSSHVTATDTSATTMKELRGSVLDVLRELLVGGNDAAVVELFTKLVSRNRELEMLLAKIRASKHSNERVAKEQLDLFLDKLRAASESELAKANETLEKTATENGGRVDPPRPPKQPPVRRPPPPGMPRVDNPIAVPASERPCPACGKERECIAHETTEVIDFKPAEVFVRLDIKEILGCDACDAELVRAPMGDKVIGGGAYGSALVAKLVVGKFWDGLPLYRQGEELARLGLSMPSSSMSDQITWATDLLRPIWALLITDVLRAIVMHVDGTSLPVLDRDSPRGIVTGSLWGYVGDTTSAVYLYTSTGKKDGQRPGEIGPADLLAQRTGPIVADASNLFDTIFESPDRMEVGCNMHARRYFVKALDANDVRAAVPVAAFRALYDVEDAVHDGDSDRRCEERQRRSKPVYDELLAWCRTYQPLEPPSSLLGRALQYLINHHVALTRFLEDGRLPIDNGIVERLHRRPAVGRRNYLFAGSHAAGERAAIAYSVLATCHLLGINPMEYLADVMPRLARGEFTRKEIRTLLPAEWKAARPRSADPVTATPPG
jgi:transposase